MQNEVCMLFWTKGYRVGVWGFKEKKGNSQEDESKHLGRKMFIGSSRNKGTQDFDQTGLAAFLPIYHN